jgi:hypothetical protein
MPYSKLTDRFDLLEKGFLSCNDRSMFDFIKCQILELYYIPSYEVIFPVQ